MTVTATGSVALTGESSEEVIEIDVVDYTSDVLIEGALSYQGGVANAPNAIGLSLTGALSGTITNEGVIILDVADTVNGIALNGIAVASGVADTGTIINSDTITVNADASNNNAGVGGIYLFAGTGTLSGTVRNDGEIIVHARADGSASAWGIYNGGNVSGTTLIENDGTIAARALSFTDPAKAYGIGVVSGDLVAGAHVANNGVIDVDAESVSDSAYGYGIYVQGDAAGDITNTGTIHAAARGNNTTADTMEAYGIYVYGTLSGTITNDDLIEVEVSTLADQYDIRAAGIYADDVAAGGVIANKSTITIDEQSEGVTYTSTIAGIWVEGTMDGTVTNDGSIIVAVDVGSVTSSELYVYGILSDGTMGGSISNTGTIDVAVNATSADSTIRAYGISTDGSDISGDITNRGMITIDLTVDSGAAIDTIRAYGIEGGDVLLGGLVANSGTIDVRATGLADSVGSSVDATAYGLDLGAIAGTVSNSGTISVMATMTGEADDLEVDAYGIKASDVDGTLSNSGTVTVAATASGSAESDIEVDDAYGIKADNVNGTLSNSGTVTVAATASGSAAGDMNASAYGIKTSTITGTGSMSNTGAFIVEAAASNDNTTAPSATSKAVGIDIGTLNGALFNSGLVMASTPNGGDAFAVKVGGGTGAATFTTESFFAGRLSLQNADLTVRSVADTGSIYWTFEDIPASVTRDDADGPKLYRNSNGDVIATVEPSNLSFSGLFAAEFADMGYDTITALMSGMPATGASVARSQSSSLSFAANDASRPSAFGSGISFFLQGDYAFRKVDDAAGRKLKYDVAGLTAGAVGQFQNGMSYGVSLSGVTADGKVRAGRGTDKVDSSGVMLGVYGSTSLGAASLTLGSSFGMLSNDSTRSMNDNLAPGGVATVNGNFDSKFISPSIELSGTVHFGSATIRPYIGYRYTWLDIDGYTETGGSGAATFEGRKVDVSDFTIGANMSMPLGMGMLTGSAEILHRGVNDSGANVTLFGIPGKTAAAATDFTALDVGVGYGMALGPGQMNFGVTGMFGNNNVSGYGLTAGYRVEF